MKEELLKLKLPEKYEENLFEFRESLDGVPDWNDLQPLGYTKEMFQKFNLLVSIERTKYLLKLDQEFNQISEDEILVVKEIIEQKIKEYNQIKLN